MPRLKVCISEVVHNPDQIFKLIQSTKAEFGTGAPHVIAPMITVAKVRQLLCGASLERSIT